MHLDTESLRTPEKRCCRRVGGKRNSRIQPFDSASRPARIGIRTVNHKTNGAKQYCTCLSLSGELNICNRRAEAVLLQLMTIQSPLVADFHHGSCGDDYIPYNPICTASLHGVKESVEHMIHAALAVPHLGASILDA